MNSRSVKNKTYTICDFVLENKYDVFLISETWLSETGDEVLIKQLTPPGYSFLHCPREGGGSGGVGLLYRSCLKLEQTKKEITYQSFEYITVRLTLSKETITLVCIYRPPRSNRNKTKDSVFHNEFTDFLDSFLKTDRFIVFGDVNYWFNAKSDSNTKKLITLFESKQLVQLIDEPTHDLGNTLDWVITRNNYKSFVLLVNVKNYLISDHFVISLFTDFSKPRNEKKTIFCRNLKGVDKEKFTEDLRNSKLITNPPSNLDELTSLYNSTLTELLNTHAPLRKKSVVQREDFEFFDTALKEAKKKRKESENVWRNTGLEIHRQIYRTLRNQYTDLLRETHSKHIIDLDQIESSGNDPKKNF